MDEIRFLHVPRTGGTSLRESWRLRPPEYQNHKAPSPARFSYGFTRNPWDRVVSLYHLLYGGINKPFREWVLAGADCDDGVIDIGAPSLWWLENAHFVGRFEQRDENLRVLCDILDRPFPEQHHGRTDRKPYRDYYDDETRGVIAKKYEADIDLFGYTF